MAILACASRAFPSFAASVRRFVESGTSTVKISPGVGASAAVLLLADFVNSLPGGMRAAFEFRHQSWFEDEVFNALKARNVALCIADTEDLTTPQMATADYGYLRLRREDYAKADVERWAEIVRGQNEHWKDTFIYFKHEEAGIGPKLAMQMTELLKEDK